MKKWLSLSCMAVVTLMVLGLSACGGGAGNTSSSSSTPAIAKVRMWITLSNNPDAPSVTTLTPEQTAQASIWARGTTEENITFKLNLVYGDKFTTLVTNVRTEGSSKAVAVGGLSAPLEPGSYTFQAISGAFGGIVGSLQITVTPSLPSTPSLTPSGQPSLPPAPASTLSEQPDKATFSKYFTDMGLGRVPAGGKLPFDIQKNISVFAQGDQFTLYGTVIQEVQVSARYYNVATKESVDVGAPSTPLKVGGFAGSSILDLQIGKYEYKVYVGGVLVGVFPFEVLAAPAATQTPQTPASTTTPSATLSEQPDQATFQKYFSEMGLGKMPADAKGPQDIQRNVTAFTAGDLFTLYGTVIQEIQISAKYYNVATKESVDAGGPPTPLKVGGFGSSSTFNLPIGKYEYKVYVGAVLVGVFPFEVVAATATQTPQTPASTTTPSAALSEQPDKATFQKYFSEMGLGKIPNDGKFPQDLQRNATVFTAGDQICLYGNIIQECQLRNAVYDVGAKKVIEEGGLPKPMTGGFAGWEPLTIPAGTYEYKVYVTDVLVAVFPFEVR